MATFRLIVNPFPSGLPTERLEDLLADYRRLLARPWPEGPPGWYSRAMIDRLEALLAERLVSA